MGIVIIDYEKFKDVLRDYLAESLIDEIISGMNDNDVFITDLVEFIVVKSKKANSAVMSTEEAIRKVKEFKLGQPISDEILSAMRETRAAIKEIKRHRYL